MTTPAPVQNVDLSIIIVNWNTRDLLAGCLASVTLAPALRSGACAGVDNRSPLSAPRSPHIEIIVVDNASTDGSVAMVRQDFPSVQLIENTENVGFGRANNQAIMHSRGRYILLLNSDTIVPTDALQRLITIADADPRIGIVGPLLRNPDGSFQAGPNDFPTLATVCLEAWGLMPKLSGNPYYPSYPPQFCQVDRSCDWVGGACMLVRRDAIDQVGLLDEQFFMNSEEVDWCRRMHEHNWTVWFTPQVAIVHLGGASASRSSATQRLRLYEGKVRYLRKHAGPFAASVSRWNFRLAALCKVVGYQSAYLFTRNHSFAQKAASHWPVVWKRKWA